MNTKLTLKSDRKTIEKTMKQAKKNNQSHSSIVENDFKRVISQNTNSPDEDTPIVKDLKGIIKLDKEYDLHKDYTDYLIKKYKYWKRSLFVPKLYRS
jgi:uncharacterized membrane protein YgaE (UPF0421/DUF939 family)